MGIIRYLMRKVCNTVADSFLEQDETGLQVEGTTESRH